MYRYKNLRSGNWILGVVLLACAACSSDSTTGDNSAGTGGAAGTSGTAAQGGTGDSSGAAGEATAGTAGINQGGSAGTSTGGDAGTDPGGAGGGGGGDSADDAGVGGDASGGTGGQGGGPVVLAGCANNDYDLCIDFEDGIDTTIWKGGTQNAIVTTEFAHGGHAYQLYKCNDATAPTETQKCGNSTSGGKFTVMNLGAITNKIWGRFYVHFSPGAPGGHGNIVGAFEGGAWYELGWQFDGLMGVWHNGGENPLRSMPYIVDKWYCVELLFDGTKTDMPSWWIDGEPAQYYKGEPNNPTKPHVITQFDRIEVGFTPYAGLEIRQPDGVGDQTERRMLSGMWIDDIAFNKDRIGCITPQ